MGTVANRTNRIVQGIAFSACCAFAASAYSAVDYPMLDIQTTGSDAAMSSDGSVLSIDASVIALILNDQADFQSLSAPVSLSAEFSSQNGFSYSFTNGSLLVGEAGSELLTATFDDFTVNYAGGGYGMFDADLTYTGGSLSDSLLTGRLEGAVQGLTNSDLSAVFTSSTVVMKVGEVAPVPVPAAIWLFGSGMLALFGVKKYRARS